MRKLKLFFACLLMAVLSIGQMWGADVEFTPGNSGGISSSAGAVSGTKSGVTVSISNGVDNGNDIRVYKGATMTITSTVGNISNIAFTFSGSNNGGWSASYAPDNASSWTSPATSGTQARCTSITVTVSGGSSEKTLSVDPTVIDFGTVEQNAVVASQTVEVSFANLTGSVAYSGLSSPFTASGSISASGEKITIAANTANVGNYSQTLTVQSTADSKSAEVTVKMNVVEPFDGLKLTFDVSANPGGWPTTNSTTTTDYTYTLNEVDYTFALNNVKCNSGYLMLTSVAKLGLPAISGYKLVKVEATNSSGCSTSTQVSVSSSDATKTDITGGAAQTWGTTSTKYTYNLSGTEENTMYYLWIANKNCQIVELVLYYEETEAATVAQPSISGTDNFLTSTEVTMTCATEGANIYYTTTESAKTNPATSGDWTAYNGASKPSFTETTTVWAAATDGAHWSSIAEQTFTKATVMTVAQALEASTGADKYVKGIISSIEEVSTEHGNATYNLKDEGQENSIKIYRGKYLNDAAFTAVNQIYEGDEVTVFGAISNYKGVNQFAQGNYIVLLKPAARLAWSEASFDAELEGANTFPSLTNTNSVAVTYSSSDETVATISSDGLTYELKKVGETTITASFGGNDQYKAKSVSYTLNVKNSVNRADISFEENGGSEVADLTQQTNLPDPLPVITKAGKNFGGWYTTSNFEDGTEAVAGAAVTSTETITLFAKWIDPYTVAVAKTVIGDNTVGIANQYVAGIISQVDEYNSKYNSITYWISADGGTTGDQLQVYSGLIGNAAEALEKDNFSSVEDLKVGDIVVVTGSLKKYGDVYEFDKNNTIYSFTRPVAQTYSITYVENGANEDIDDDDAATNLPNPLPTVTKSGKVFGGWWTTSTFEDGSQAVAGAQLSDDVILYAKWNDLSQWAYTYTSNIALAVDENDTKAYAEKVKITVEEVLTEFPALRAATGSAAGTCHVIVPAGTQTLHFHAAAWNNKTSTLTVKMGETTLLSQALTADAGINTNSPYTLAGNAYEYYYSIDLSSYNLTEETRITFSAASGKQSVIFGVNQEGGIVPELQSIEIDGDLTTKSYKAGDALDLDGLTVNAIYSLGGTPQTPVDITDDAELELTYDPLVENQTSVTITATYKGQTDDITINDLVVTSADPKIYVSTLNVNFASVEVGESVPAAETVTVTLTNVASVTATLGGTNADAFSVSPASLTESGDITISILANTDAAASYAATLTISDGEGGADDKTVNLSFEVTEPVVEDDVTGTWTLVTNATTLAAGKKVIIAQYVEADGAINTMAGQASNNRSVIASTVAGATLTPTVGTKVMTLADAGEGHFYLKTSDGEYLYNASGTKSYLRTKATSDDASWTIEVDADGVATITAVENTTRPIMRYNPNTSGSPLFNCYASGQEDIALYMLEEDAPEPPTPDYGSYNRDNLTPGNYATICLPNGGTISGATLFDLDYYDGASTLYLLEVNGNAMVAGRPYIFLPEANEITVTYTDNAGADAGSFRGLVGSYSQQNINEIEGDNYILYNNAYYLVNSTAYVGANRAYIHMADVLTVPSTPQAGQAPRRRVGMTVHGEQTTTDIDALNAAEAPVKVIIEGKLYIIRGEKMYNVNGQVVK